MAKIFLLLNKDENCEITRLYLEELEHEIMESQGAIEDILTQIHHFCPDMIIAVSDYENCDFLLRQIKAPGKNQNSQLIMILNENHNPETMNIIDGIIEAPVKKDILVNTINSHLKIKKSLDRLYENNKELSKSLYQLNVLYNTSSQFAGTLNTDKLYEIMIEAMERTLSYDISAVLLFSTSQKPVFNLNTISTPSENLIDALKIRSILNYKTLFDENAALKNRISKDLNDIQIVQKIKQEPSNKIYGLEAISFDSLFAPIKVGDEIFGVVELFRQVPFSSEDVTCFQAITHQVALPLRSARLYEEISTTNKKLEKLERLKSEFISIVSHELRTPLQPLKSSMEIILSGAAGQITDEAKNFIGLAKNNINRLSGIIEDLLDLSRIETGKFNFEYKKVDITQSLELLKNTFEQAAKEKNIKITLDIKEKLPEIYADIRRIEQIFSNLVSNALKFTPENGAITVSAKVIDDSDIVRSKLIMPQVELNGKYIQITVSDNGIGMKSEDIPKIFDKFSQIESSLNRNKGGIGLGLAITKQLIDSHLGAIWVESVEKQGSDFNVILPLADESKIFEMDLMKALIKSDNVGIIKIKAKKSLNLIEILKEKKLINITPLSKELMLDEGDYIQYYFFIPKISYESFVALFNTLKECCSKIEVEEHDIMLSKAHSSIDGDRLRSILKS